MYSPLATSKPYPCPSGHREPLGWVVNLVGHTTGPGAFLVASDSRLALLTCSFSSWEMELLNLATSSFIGRGFVEMQMGALWSHRRSTAEVEDSIWV